MWMDMFLNHIKNGNDFYQFMWLCYELCELCGSQIILIIICARMK